MLHAQTKAFVYGSFDVSQSKPFLAGVDSVSPLATAMRASTTTPSALENKFKASAREAQANGWLEPRS